MLDGARVYAEVIVSLAKGEMEFRAHRVCQAILLQHPFHLSDQRTVRLSQSLDMDNVVIRGDLTAVERDPQIVGCRRVLEPAQLHQNRAEQTVRITVLRIELDCAPDRLFGGRRLLLLYEEFRLADQSETGAGFGGSGAAETVEDLGAIVVDRQQVAELCVRFGKIRGNGNNPSKRGNRFGSEPLALESEAPVVMGDGEIGTDLDSPIETDERLGGIGLREMY